MSRDERYMLRIDTQRARTKGLRWELPHGTVASTAATCMALTRRAGSGTEALPRYRTSVPSVTLAKSLSATGQLHHSSFKVAALA